MTKHTARAALLNATKSLLWRHGYEATSPRDIQAASNVGQGSFYHHFDGKASLAAAALQDVSEEMSAQIQTTLESADCLRDIEAYLCAPRDALRGCRLGRLANEVSITSTETLREPIARYFETSTVALRHAIERAQHKGEIAASIQPADLAFTLVAVIQGGYVLSRLLKEQDAMDSATRGAIALLREAAHRDLREKKQ